MADINDLIYAYSLGSLDPEDYQKIINLNDHEVDFKELGEYQNLVALLPTILTIETPDPLLKDNVAKKLYSLTEQKKTVTPSYITQDITSEENETPVTEITGSLKYPDNDEKSLDNPIVDEEISSDEIINNIIEKTNISNNTGQILQNDKSNLTVHKESPSRYSDPGNKTSTKMIWGIILFGLLALGLFIAYLNISSKTDELNKEVNRLKREVFQLNLQLKSTQEMQNIVQSPNLLAMNLTGTELNKSGFGKLFIDSAKGLGYIQLGQMPGIPEDKTFQLWAKLPEGIKSLGTFHVPDKGGYYSFNIQNLHYDGIISFLITEEPSGGSTSPGNKVYLQGKYNP